MTSFNRFKKGLSSVKGVDSIPGLINSGASLAQDLVDPTSSAFVKGSGNSAISLNEKVLRYPDLLGTREWPAWLEITVHKRVGIQKELQRSFDRIGESAAETFQKTSQAEGIAETITSAVVGGVDVVKNTAKATSDVTNAAQRYNYRENISEPIMSINLPLQANMGQDNVSVDVGSEEAGIIGGQLLNSEKSFASAAKAAGQALFAREIKTAGIGTSLKLMTGHVENPYSYNLFKGVNHRSFDYTWNLSPVSAEETNRLYDIIDLMKTFMLPKNKGALFEVPYEFKIKFKHIVPVSVNDLTGEVQYGVQENPYFPESNFCYLQSITHIPNEQGDTLHGEGAPVTHQIQMQFAEIEPMDRDNYTRINSNKKRIRDGEQGAGLDSVPDEEERGIFGTLSDEIGNAIDDVFPGGDN